MPFRITAIKHLLPQNRPVDEDADQGFVFRPVTGIFIHQSNDVWTLEFDSGDTLGVTASHPVYTLDKVVCDIGASCFPAYMPTLRQLAVASLSIVGILHHRPRLAPSRRAGPRRASPDARGQREAHGQAARPGADGV